MSTEIEVTSVTAEVTADIKETKDNTSDLVTHFDHAISIGSDGAVTVADGAFAQGLEMVGTNVAEVNAAIENVNRVSAAMVQSFGHKGLQTMVDNNGVDMVSLKNTECALNTSADLRRQGKVAGETYAGMLSISNTVKDVGGHFKSAKTNVRASGLVNALGESIKL